MIEKGDIYKSKSGVLFEVVNCAKHAQDCSHFMVVYINLTDTIDSVAGTVWVLDYSIFKNRMEKVVE